MRRIGAIALVLWTGLACAMSAEAKPKHQPFKCKAGYTRRDVRIPKRVHGRIVRKHGRIVYIKVQRCVKTPKPKPSSPAPPRVGTPTTPTTPQPPGTPTVPSPSPTTTTTTTTAPPPPPPPPPPAPVVVAVGDIACKPGDTAHSCKQSATEAVAQKQNPNAVFVLGDNQYEDGSLSEYDGAGAYNSTWGVFNPIVHPVPGNHEYGTPGATGYFGYFGPSIANPDGTNGYYSFNLGNWHIVALNSDCTDQGCGDALDGGTTTAQLTWLSKDLADERAANPNACVLAMWHHPLFSAGWTLGVPNVAPLYNALYAAHADVVLNGHDHLYERFAQMDGAGNATTAGVREFVIGTGGENLNGFSYPKPPTLQAWDTSDFGVLVLTLHASSYTWKFVNTSDGTMDSGSTGCHGAGAGAAIAGAVRHADRTLVSRLGERPPCL